MDHRKKKLREIQLGFKAEGNLNELIFRAYLNDLEQLRLKPMDVKMAATLADTLSRTPLGELKSWRDAWRLAEKLDIRYSNQDRYLQRRHDPVLKVAKELERAGVIPADSIFSLRYERILRSFDPKTRKIIERYTEEMSGHARSLRLKTKLAAAVRAYARYLEGKDLFNHDPRLAQTYILELPVKRGKEVYAQFLTLRRFFRWSVEAGLSSADPYADWSPKESLMISCEICGKRSRATSHTRLCNSCFSRAEAQASRDGLSELVRAFKAPSAYNQHLLDLYVKYLKRHKVTRQHRVSTQALMQWLESRPLPAIRSWSEVMALSEEFKKAKKLAPTSVCPFVKIGRMLQELGVLPIREIDREHQIEKLMGTCPEEISLIFRRYYAQLRKMKYRSISQYGTIRTLVEVQYWLSQNRPEYSLLTVSAEILKQYVLSLGNQDRGGIRRYILRRFYRWLCLEKLALFNPMEGIAIPKSIRKLCICTDHQIRQIEKFVKNPKSDPEQALLLTLSLYWGFNAKDLAFASIEIHDSQIWILVHRQPLTRGRHSHYREQVLKLPLEPAWLGQLQKRYIRLWRERFEQIQKSFPVQPLVLGSMSNRHLTSTVVMEFFYEATIAATGVRIPPSVVRRTSAHIHTRYGDASRLAKLGWAQRHCHDFAIYPRTYFAPKSTR
jgi:hypothetical protein